MMSKTPWISRSESDTAGFASDLARTLRFGDVLFLEGDLGMGKSVFARALIRTLCDDPGLEVPSPTFTLVQTYDGTGMAIWHFDLYRIKAADEVYELGWDDALAGGIVIVEWASNLGAALAPPDRLEIGLTPLLQQPGGRKLVLTPYGQWRTRL